MAYTILGIANMALARIGVARLSVWPDTITPQGIAANDVWEYIRDEVLEAKEWRFAKTRTFLGDGAPVDSETNIGWNYGYQLPPDFLRLARPTKTSMKEDLPVYPPGYDYKVEVVGGDSGDYFILLTDYDNANEDMYIVYIKRQVDLALWSPTAISALAFRWAAEMTFKLTEGKNEYDTMMSLYGATLLRAEEITQSYDSEDEMGNDDWVSAGR
jgi:hypothetical protein